MKGQQLVRVNSSDAVSEVDSVNKMGRFILNEY